MLGQGLTQTFRFEISKSEGSYPQTENVDWNRDYTNIFL